ncbi:MAG: hypothetical protein CMI36_07275 [Owenweeksia sp.]|nr:hypothetical protein [Owenweeksia sp.]MBF98774.1 hypothetical protein [Owenweeksia sp.]HBF21844.1 hypothetical protein [Cryomorphaceae bacterium]|tara:strand:- start:2065 stop:3975 length:1911 start_codon:yes stop_codon:yes gene_type:complete
MKKKIPPFIVLIALMISVQSMAQQTGSFNTQVTIMGQSRTLACYVPTNYDPNVSYRLMIGLHGLGDNGNAYRNALITVLKWPSIFPNTIFVFPDGGTDANSDFYVPAGDEIIIDSARSFAMSNYNIDNDFVVLQGFSLGGRSAIKYGLDHPTEFKGLLLNTPAFQGKNDVQNHPVSSLQFNYANASQLPIYLTVGDQDFYYRILGPAVKKLKMNDAVIRYLPVAGLGHSIPDSAKVVPSFTFFEHPEVADFDLDLFDIELSQHTCDASITPACFVQNRGSAPVTSVEVDYQFAGGSGTYTWTGSINAYEHARIDLPSMVTADGEQALQLSIGKVNGTENDTVVLNNQRNDTISVDLIAESTPLNEGFESVHSDWVITETGTIFQWSLDDEVSRSGQYSMATFNTILAIYTYGNVESFESPVMDLTNTIGNKLTFDVAYNYHKYTPPYFLSDTIFADTLEVVLSTDCGLSWQSLYKKGGAELATVPDPIVNALNLNQCFLIPADSSEWRTDTIDLSAYDQESSVIIRFNYISGEGGSINLDNIHVNGLKIGLVENPDNLFKVYPNPARDYFRIQAGLEEITSLRIWDMGGSLVLQDDQTQEPDTERQLDISNLPTGLYQLEVEADGQRGTSKLMITK